MLDLWIHSCTTDKIYETNSCKPSPLPLLYHKVSQFVSLILSPCLQLCASFIMPLSQKDAQSSSVKWDMVQLWEAAHGPGSTPKKEYLQITIGRSVQKIQLLDIKSCLEPMRSEVKNEKMPDPVWPGDGYLPRAVWHGRWSPSSFSC